MLSTEFMGQRIDVHDVNPLNLHYCRPLTLTDSIMDKMMEAGADQVGCFNETIGGRWDRIVAYFKGRTIVVAVSPNRNAVLLSNRANDDGPVDYRELMETV